MHDTSEGFGRRLFFYWADRPWMQLCVFVVITTLAVIGYVRPALLRDLLVRETLTEAAINDAGIPSTNSETRPEVQPFRVSGGECIVVVTSEDIFRQANIRALRDVVSRLEELPQVDDILWLNRIPGLNLFGLPEPLLPPERASARQIEISRQRTLENPFAVGQFISADAKTLLLHLRIDWFYATSDAACTTALREAAEAASRSVPGSDLQFQVTGRAPLHLMMANNHLRDAWRYQIIGYSLMIIAALVLFRGLSAVIIVSIAPATGVFWTLGILRFFDLQDNPFNDIIVPILISLVGVADAVHLMVEIRNQRGSGLNTRSATRVGVARVGMACALTSLTTAIGFASLAWAHHRIVQEFGWCCVLGVGLTFLSVLTIVPLGCRSPLGWRLHHGAGKSLVDSQLRRIDPLVGSILRNHGKIAWIAIAATVSLGLICTQLQPDEKLYSGLSESGEAAQALRHLDRSLGGLEFGYVRVSWPATANRENGELLDVLEEVHRTLAQEPLIGQPLGLREVLAALPGSGTNAERMSLLELLPATLKRAFYEPEQGTATVQFRVQDVGIAQYSPVFDRIETELAQVTKRHPDFILSLDGAAVRRWQNVFQIVTDLATSLGTASVVIWLILTVVYRSIRIGLISLVPNVFPLVATGAILCFTGQYLEIVTVCVFTICIGIAVDDTIHFLTRYREEVASGDTHEEAIRRAFTGVGSALLMTTIVLVTGMMTAVFGDARDARLFGIMGAITLTSALFADMIFLPALLQRFAKPPGKTRAHSSPGIRRPDSVSQIPADSGASRPPSTQNDLE